MGYLSAEEILVFRILSALKSCKNNCSSVAVFLQDKFEIIKES